MAGLLFRGGPLSTPRQEGPVAVSWVVRRPLEQSCVGCVRLTAEL